MNEFDDYVDILIKSCVATIEQMTRIKVQKVEKRQVLKDDGALPAAHIISYTDKKSKMEGTFILGFQTVNDALTLASGISTRLGLKSFDNVCEDSTDLLNEFLNIVVGRTISEWDEIGLSVDFAPPVFKENHINKAAEHLKGYIIIMDIVSDIVDLEQKPSKDQLMIRVNFQKKIENKIKDKRILLAEDSKVMRSIIAKMLKEQGATIKEAANGKEAVKFHDMFKPDLTLMDINMPEMNGLDAIAKIKETQPKAKFIILSSSSRKDEILSAKTLKVAGYLVKPVEQDKLIERVSAVL